MVLSEAVAVVVEFELCCVESHFAESPNNECMCKFASVHN